MLTMSVCIFAVILFLPFSIAQGGKLTAYEKEKVKDIIALSRSKVTYNKAQELDKKWASYGQVIHELEEVSYRKRKAKADAGDVDEQVTLAQILQKAGRFEEAKYYYALAGAQGDEEAQKALLTISEHETAHVEQLESLVGGLRIYHIVAPLVVSAFVMVCLFYRCIASSRKLKLLEKDV